MASWFTNIANQAIEYADSFADSLVAQANDAQQQLIEEQTKIKQEQAVKSRMMNTFATLPWETEEESLAILSQDLMERIMEIPMNDLNFTEPPKNVADVSFVLSEFIPTAMNLLKIDSNLARVHSKISPKMEEEEFWRNYYCRIMYLRQVSGIEGPQAKQEVQKWDGVVIVHEPASAQIRPASERGQNPCGEPPVARTSQASSERGKGGFKGDDGEDVDEEEDDDAGNDDADSGEDEGQGGGGGDADLLEELDDLDDLDFEEIGKSEYTGDTGTTSNDELEAQIARELAEDMDDDL